MKILLGLTGSVASVLYEKLIKQLGTLGDTNVILTNSAHHFVGLEKLRDLTWSRAIDHHHRLGCFDDSDEWEWYPKNSLNPQDKRTIWQKDDSVLHIKLRDDASALVIAPCSANTLAKLANGICDNLLTSVARAWDFNRPVIIAPAMNTYMWDHPTTQQHIQILKGWGFTIVPPQSKMLACGTEGMGAMANIEDIVKALKERLQWFFPLSYSISRSISCPGVPVKGHPGSFLCKRKHHTHTGVDLYTKDDASVCAVESGVVVGKEQFTGAAQQTPWWEDTDCVLVEGASGVVCYGEIGTWLNVGDKVRRGEVIAAVKRVLPLDKRRPDIKGHSCSMLHMEIYPHGKYKAFEELGPTPDDFKILVDPTPFLLEAENSPGPL